MRVFGCSKLLTPQQISKAYLDTPLQIPDFWNLSRKQAVQRPPLLRYRQFILIKTLLSQILIINFSMTTDREKYSKSQLRTTAWTHVKDYEKILIPCQHALEFVSLGIQSFPSCLRYLANDRALACGETLFYSFLCCCGCV